MGGQLTTALFLYQRENDMTDEKQAEDKAQALIDARQALAEMPEDTRKALLGFWKAHYRIAGHRRLGKMLVVYMQETKGVC